MCLILAAWCQHEDYPLVVAANRDEFFARPTQVAGFWPDAPMVVAGRDLEAGGTWMGYTRKGRFAALTNFRDPQNTRPGALSRGKLVVDFLAGTQSPSDYLQRIESTSHQYNGYNLLLGDSRTLWWSSNLGGTPRQLDPGVYGVSNHLLDSPWPKVGAGKAALSAGLASLPDERELFSMLGDDTVHPDGQLPLTGIPLEWERLLSAAFVKSPVYGTRSSTLLLAGTNRWVVFDEQTWLPGARRGPRHRFHFRIDAPSPDAASRPP